MSRSIIVLPDDWAKPILDAIANAAKSIKTATQPPAASPGYLVSLLV
jgi:hypothetical protein